MCGSESPVRMQSYPAGLCKLDRLVCTFIDWRACTSLLVVLFSADSVPLSASSAILQRARLCFRPAVVQSWVAYGMPDRLYKSQATGYPHRDSLNKHIGRLAKCQLAGVQLPTGFDNLDRPFHSGPTMQFSTG